MEYLKRNDEENWQYYMRLYDNKDKYGLTFSEIGELLNEVYGSDWNEAKYRRMYDGYKMFQDFVGKENLSHEPEQILKDIEKEKIELKKERWKTRDQRRENEKIIREMARLEHLVDFLKEFVEEVEPVNIPVIKKEENSKVGFVTLSDWHIGANIDNIFNKFNSEVAEERIKKFKSETLERLEKEKVSEVYIINLGDSIMGHIHTTARIESEENAIQQIIRASQYFEDFIKDFVLRGYDVTFANIGGNHNRIIPNKKDSLGTNESFERLITVYLDKAFNKFDNYRQIDDEYGIVELKIKGKNVVCVHGDLDRTGNPITSLNEMLDNSIDYLFSGHVHNAFYKEHGKATHIGIGSLMGADSYATQNRYSSRPSQSYFIFDDDGLDTMKVVYF